MTIALETETNAFSRIIDSMRKYKFSVHFSGIFSLYSSVGISPKEHDFAELKRETFSQGENVSIVIMNRHREFVYKFPLFMSLIQRLIAFTVSKYVYLISDHVNKHDLLLFPIFVIFIIIIVSLSKFAKVIRRSEISEETHLNHDD